MKSLKKNFMFNTVYQILILIIPLITIPYVSRVIGPTGVGMYSYTYSIVYYFMIFAMLGLNNYGNRTIAKIRDDKEKLTETFKEIHLLQVLVGLFSLALYCVFLLSFGKKNMNIYIIQSMHLISCIFDINWFFFGLEEFKKTVIRNTIVKILSLFLIFLLVKTKGDLLIYVGILSGSVLLSQILLWPFVNKFIDKNVKIKIRNVKKHFFPCLKLFLPVIAVTIYRVIDKTMLGLMVNTREVGYYENAEKIISVLVAIISALGTVMLPRMSNLYAKGDNEKTKLLIKKSISIIMFIALPMCAGLAIVSKNFAVLFFGTKFTKSGLLMIYLSVTIPLLAWGNIIRTLFLIPKERDYEYIVSAFIGAFVNLALNIILIPLYKSIGACIGTIIAELSVTLYQTIKVRKNLPIIQYVIDTIPFFIKTVIMAIIIYMINFVKIAVPLKVIIQIVVGCLIYGLLNIKYILSIIDINMVLKKLKLRKA